MEANEPTGEQESSALASPPLCHGFIPEDEELAGFGKDSLREIQLLVRKSHTWALGAAGFVQQQWPGWPQPRENQEIPSKQIHRTSKNPGR